MNSSDFNLKHDVLSSFTSRYGGKPLLVKSPGRINLIGEHTDYNDGFVLPAAIDKTVYVAMKKNGTDRIRLYAREYDESFEISILEIKPFRTQPWINYILGVVDQLIKSGYTLSGFDLVIMGDIPIGAGLSSSAAVECATAFALNEIFELHITRLELVKLSQQAEHEFAGVKCGIMDQFASVFGKKNKVIKLDCRSLDYEYVPMNLEGYKIVLFDTHVKHSHASSAYNARREECEAAVSVIRKKYSQINSLRDATIEMVKECVRPVNGTLFNRAYYVIDEIGRVLGACEDLKLDNLPAFGRKMFATHEGLSQLYEVSCIELDFLVDFVKRNPFVIGARMMGGGFGGCTINLIREDAVSMVVEGVEQGYWNNFKKNLTTYLVSFENGTNLA